MDYDELTKEFMELFAHVSRHPFHRKGSMETTKGEGRILMYLSQKQEEASAGELKEELSVVSGRIANALKSLEKKGYIVRSRSAADRRLVMVDITEKGRELVARMHGEFMWEAKRLFEALGEEDTKEFLRIMKRIFEIESGMRR